MWHSLACFADIELEANEKAAKESYEKLKMATFELQKHVKELLSEYPGALAEEPGTPSMAESTGWDKDGMAHAARLLSSLCSQPARNDTTSAPGAIYTPRGGAWPRGPTDTGPSIFEGSKALRAFLAADVPSARWGALEAPGAEAGRRLLSMDAAPGHWANGQRPAHSLSRVRLERGMAGAAAQDAVQEEREELRAWAFAALRELHPDVSLEDVHAALLRHVVQQQQQPQQHHGNSSGDCGGSPSQLLQCTASASRGGGGCGDGSAEPLRDGEAWFMLPGNEDVVVRSLQLLLGLVNTSNSSLEAWDAVTQAFTHSLVDLDGEAARLLKAGTWRGAETGTPSVVSRTFDITPASYQTYIKDLQDKIDQLLEELLLQGELEDGAGSPRPGQSFSEKDLAAYRLAMTPRSFLQVVGQKLLHHAALQLPCMTELPERIPDWTLRNLYGRPFAEAVKLTIQHGMAAISEAFGPSDEGQDGRVRGGKLAQSLLYSGGGGRLNDPKKPGPRQQQSQSLLSKRAASAVARFNSSRVSAGHGRPRPAATASRDPGRADGAKGDDAFQRVLSRARSAVELLFDVDRDTRGFQGGFAAILQWPRASGSQRHGSSLDLQRRSVSLQCTASYLSVLRAETARVFHEVGPTLRTFLYGSIISAAQMYLDGDDPHQPPCPVPLSPVTWPEPEEPTLQSLHHRAPAQVPADRAPSGNTAALSRSCSSLSTSHEDGSAAVQDDACALLLRRDDVAPSRSRDRCTPPRIDATSYRILEFASWLLSRVVQLPEPLQPVLAGAALECLSMLMDRLSTACAGLRDLPGHNSQLHLALLFHSAACCVRRRLEAMHPWQSAVAAAAGEAAGMAAVAAAAVGPHESGPDVDLIRQHGETLVQADELVTSIHQHIVLSFMQVMYDVVLSSWDRTNWCAFRPEVMRGQCAGPAVRVWHSMLLRLLHAVAHYVSPDAAERILGQVLQDSMACLTLRYLRVGPTIQMLREFVADAVHLTASAFLFCQPIPVRDSLGDHAPPHCGGSGSGGGRPTGHSAGWEGAQPRDSASDGLKIKDRSGTAKPQKSHERVGTKAAAYWLRAPLPVVRALTGTARALLTRAALLHIPGSQLAEIARQAGLTREDAVVAPKPRWVPELLEPPEQPAGRSEAASGIGGGGGGGLAIPLPPVRAPGGRPPESLHGAVSGLGLGMAGMEGKAPSRDPDASAAAAAATIVGTSQRDIPSRGAFAASSSDPWVAGVTTKTAVEMTNGERATDEERLALWGAWLPNEVLCALTGAAEAIELAGAGAAVDQLLLIPLGDRMADVAQTGSGGHQGTKEAQGPMWRACLEHLARRASPEDMMLALARRHELHAAVGTEPPGNEESRRIVRGMARRLGLLTVEVEDE